ncbi:response regulator receiver domain [Acinetobacter sp. IRS14]|uniref:response regulator receiver domain n=1 Tax=Acinetobacter sp. IRS14 TaxID=2983398 RepID=UPI002AFE08FF|nr:response regulator receiver domain [Acinetobacter sp. IRS14]MEA1229399.1 response regulator receiver domain [Acinetobacter sp. IRS14]
MNTQVQGAMTQNFFDISRSIAERFIQTVVAVDDKITFGEVRNKSAEGSFELIVPPLDESGIGEVQQDQVIQLANLKTNDENELNYQELSECFAEKSILCTALKTFSGADSEEKTIVATFNLSKKADITILDWQMENNSDNYGKIAKGSVSKLIEYDVSCNGRLRLVLIYTSADIALVMNELLEELNQYHPERENETSIIFPSEDLKLCKILVINKTENIQQLVDTSIQEFAEMTCGLLSNATLAAITEIRDKTHHYLYKFNKKLDTAYLSHILSLITSEDMRESSHDVAFDYAVDLISEEIKSNLQISKIIKESLSRECLKKWPHHINPDNQAIHSFNVSERPTFSCNNERMEKFLTVIDENELIDVLDELPKYPGGINKFKGQFIQFQLSSPSEAAHLELSAIECLRRDILNLNEVIPVLKQGTIIKKDETYFVCIQPICDSVRLTCATSFLFLKTADIGGIQFSHVVRKDRNQYEKVKFKPVSKEVCLMKFIPDNKMIRAKREHGKFVFESTNSEKFEWCGEFKQAITQEIVNAVSGSISRVGFDSFEWLRLRKPKL